MCARVSQSRRAPLAHVMAASPASFIQTPIAPALLAGFWAFAERQDLSPSVALRLVVHHVIGRAGFVVQDYDPQAERRCDFQNWARRRRRAIDENGIHPVLIARVTPGFKEAFGDFAQSREQSSPAALKAIVQHIVVSARIDPSVMRVPKTAERLSERIATRFSKEEMAALEQHAHDYGSVRAWLVALARSQIAAGAPQFTTAALEALYESNRELASIGRNVNQISHALNLDLQQSGQLRGSMGLLDELATLKLQIDAHTQRVRELCTASASRWNHP